MKFNYIKLAALSLIYFFALNVKGQGNGIRPQIWNNVNVDLNFNEKFSLRNNLAYNVLLSSELPWSEITFSSTAVFKYHRFMEASAGLYLAAVNQTEKLNSSEYRPYVGFRVFTNTAKRWYVTNLTRFELRLFHYSDDTEDQTIRFRNRTYAVFSLNKKTMVENNTLFFFGYFEMFFNFNNEVEERFFDLYKYKIGLGYRLSYTWRFDIGFVFQESRNTINQPVNLPSNIITNYIFEWGVAYIIKVKGRD